MANVWQQDWLEKWALYSPDKVCLKEFETGNIITYAQINSRATAAASWLFENFKLSKNTRIAIVADFCIEYVVLFSVAQKSGITLIPLNYRLAPDEIAHILIASTPEVIIYESKYEHLIHDVLDSRFLNLEKFISSIDGYSNFKSFKNNTVGEDDPIFILYTAGTTGLPKGVLYTHKMLFWNSINTAISLIVNSESRTINVMPPFHTGGWNVLLTPFLHHGAYTVICKKFDPEATLKYLQTENITIFMAVPTMLQMITQQPEFEHADFPSLLYLIVGGEPLPIPLIEKWASKDVAVRQGYGMTEVGPNLTSLHQSDAIRKMGSIGRPNFYVKIKVVDSKGNEVPKNTSGELWLQGPMVTPGYLNNQLGTKEAFSEDGMWFKSGDMVKVDDEDYIYVVDRLKNMYISGGENVYPAEIERVLNQHPAINECAVIAVKHEKWGQTGRAIVVLNSNFHLNENEIIQYCAEKLAKFKVPKSVVFIDAIPKSDAGKLDRKKLLNTYSK
jgi:fatty-acyl-CoA synthase